MSEWQKPEVEYVIELRKLREENERLKEELTEAERQYSNGLEFLNETAEERDTLKAKLAEVEAELDDYKERKERAFQITNELMEKDRKALNREREAANKLREQIKGLGYEPNI